MGKISNVGVNPSSASPTHEESNEPRRSKRARVVKDFGNDFVTYNIEDDLMDVKIAFLYGEFEEEIYMDQLEGFVAHSNEHKVCKLVKSLYGLQQSPKQWHEKFDKTILAMASP
ncbi:Retrovirus-related Pol polyprotein from transposon TNT 1-94 [Sesamum angolense]|uniref:Retrovirus-related Pol polyprotein from transposon TNT 1-94 n=1 Tax=Sesamum angolense TaxID=2727404 RepID=A0AAE1WAU1_9LAMI|nr:Retrovirus-related Pol polyprotein from transposon TNT 1-94 [Sesamum angolense]